MKKLVTILVLIIGLSSFQNGITQTIDPVITFKEDPKTHNMHLCSDGQYLYTVNGGKAPEGQIGKFSLSGNLIGHYPIELDMRSIMYNKKDKSLYVCCYDNNIYRIVDIENGSYELVYSKLYPNEQSCLALDPKGKYLYAFDNGTLNIYDFVSGKLINTFENLNHGEDIMGGSTTVAVGKKNIYTWDSENKIIYIFDLKGKFIKSVSISEGTYGFSLSFANGLIFISEDGNYFTGTWYGYKIPRK